MADRDDVTTLGDVNLLHGHRYSQHDGLEGQREVLLDRRVKSNSLLGLGYASTMASSMRASRRAGEILGRRDAGRAPRMPVLRLATSPPSIHSISNSEVLRSVVGSESISGPPTLTPLRSRHAASGLPTVHRKRVLDAMNQEFFDRLHERSPVWASIRRDRSRRLSEAWT